MHCKKSSFAKYTFNLPFVVGALLLYGRVVLGALLLIGRVVLVLGLVA